MRLFKFKILVLMLITSISGLAQNELVYSKTFETNLSTTAIFNLENTTVAIEESDDNRIHFDYKIEFNNYSKKEVQSFLNNISVEATMYKNNITLMANSTTKVATTSYAIDSPFGITFDSESIGTDKEKYPVFRKSKDSIINLINDDNSVAFLKKLRFIDDNKKEKPIDLSKVKMYKSQFVIKLPKSIKLKIVGKESQVTMRDDVESELSVNLKKGFFKAKKLLNEYNKFKIEKANFKSEGIIGGNYDFINVTNGLIGSISDVILNSELSKIQIGLIGKNNFITDFNSEYWFYNWSTNFNRFDLYSQYSTIHYFYPETDYALKVVGNNTVNYFGKTKVVMQPSKKGEKFNLMERKAKGNSSFAGNINIDIVDGVIYSNNDTFVKNEN